jgi:hypothetical protein
VRFAFFYESPKQRLIVRVYDRCFMVTLLSLDWAKEVVGEKINVQWPACGEFDELFIWHWRVLHLKSLRALGHPSGVGL